MDFIKEVILPIMGIILTMIAFCGIAAFFTRDSSKTDLPDRDDSKKRQSKFKEGKQTSSGPGDMFGTGNFGGMDGDSSTAM